MRQTVFPLPLYVVLIILIFCWPTIVFGQVAAVAPLHVLDKEGVSIRLMATPCVDGRASMMIAMNVPPEKHAKFQALDSTWRMGDGSYKDFAGCWVELTKEETGSAEAFLLFFSDGEGYVVPKAAFKKPKGSIGT